MATVMPVDLKTQLFDRLAQLIVLDVSEQQMARACGLPLEKVRELKEHPDIKEKVQEQQNNELEKAERFNKGWDLVEELSIVNIVEELERNPEPDFSLKAAAIANKAARRHNNNPAVINPLNGGTAVFHLNVAFIERLQQFNAQQRIHNMEQKRQAEIVSSQRAIEILEHNETKLSKAREALINSFND